MLCHSTLIRRVHPKAVFCLQRLHITKSKLAGWCILHVFQFYCSTKAAKALDQRRDGDKKACKSHCKSSARLSAGHRLRTCCNHSEQKEVNLCLKGSFTNLCC